MRRNDRKSYERYYKEESGLPAELEANGPGTKNGTVANAVLVKLRKGPSLHSEVVGTARNGDPIEILGKDGNFYKVRTNDLRVVYIASGYVKEEP